MAVRVLGIKLRRPGAYRRVVQVTDSVGAARDLTGYTAKMAVKVRSEDADPAVLTLVPVINAGAGQITISITRTQVATLTGTDYVYDLIIDNGQPDGVEHLLQGSIAVTQGITTP